VDSDRFTIRSMILAGVAAVVSVIAFAPAPCRAQGKLDASYTASLAGVPVGSGGLNVDVGSQEYAASGNGQVEGLIRMFSGGGRGSVAAQGRLNREHPAPASYRATVSTGQLDYNVHMVLQGGNVKELTAEPPLVPAPDRVPVTDAHRRGIMDPVTAVIMPVDGSGDVLSAAACNRVLPIFDGHQRFNIALKFKRMDHVKAEAGYEGPVVVCNAAYQPVAGHRPGRFAVKYLQQQTDIEVWLAPIAGTHLVAPFRVSVPTLFGTAVVEARRFLTSAAPAHVRTGAARQTQAGRPDVGQLDAQGPPLAAASDADGDVAGAATNATATR